jgi:hypothetical protein
MYNLFKQKKGILDNVLNLIVGVIAMVGVAVPITVQTVNNVSPSTSGITTTVLSYLPVFVVLGALAFVAYNFFRQ